MEIDTKDYYYIKFKPIRYEDEPCYLCVSIFSNDIIRKDPKAGAGLKIFDDIETAIEYKHNNLSDESFQGTYLFEHYAISIERL